MAAFFPKTVARLSALAHAGGAPSDELRRLQFAVSRAEEFVARYGVLGIKEAVFRLTGHGTSEGGRLPLKGRLADEEWGRARKMYFEGIEKMEAEL